MKIVIKWCKNSGRDIEFLIVLLGLNELLYVYFFKIEFFIICNFDYLGLFDFFWRFLFY